MKSMTGFGKAHRESREVAIDVTLKSVNGRFLEVRFHGPRLYSTLEMEIKKRVSHKLSRGTVDLSIVRRPLVSREKVTFNQNLAKKWLDGFNLSAKKLGLETLKDPRLLLQIPDFFRVEEPDTINPGERKLLFHALEQALEKLDQTRRSEGAALKKGIQSDLKDLKSEVSAIKKMSKKIRPELEARCLERIHKIENLPDVDPQRLLLEIAIQVDKCDIGEEIIRLETHIGAINSLIGETSLHGKRLDFYAQELLREVNTIGSKSTSASLTKRVIQAKSCIEKYREQVQNLE